MITQELLNLPNQNLWTRVGALRVELTKAQRAQLTTVHQAKIAKKHLYLIVNELRKLPGAMTLTPKSPEFVMAWQYVCEAYEYAKNIQHSDGYSLTFQVKLALDAVEKINE